MFYTLLLLKFLVKTCQHVLRNFFCLQETNQPDLKKTCFLKAAFCCKIGIILIARWINTSIEKRILHSTRLHIMALQLHWIWSLWSLLDGDWKWLMQSCSYWKYSFILNWSIPISQRAKLLHLFTVTKMAIEKAILMWENEQLTS